LKIEYKNNKIVEMYKARLVAKENTQTWSIDYLETFLQ